MKLYATVTSERASKGQGGNRYVSFMLNGELGEKPIFTLDAVALDGGEVAVSIPHGDGKACYVVKKNGGGYMISVDEFKKLLMLAKGEKQKGETSCMYEHDHSRGGCSFHD